MKSAINPINKRSRPPLRKTRLLDGRQLRHINELRYIWLVHVDVQTYEVHTLEKTRGKSDKEMGCFRFRSENAARLAVSQWVDDLMVQSFTAWNMCYDLEDTSPVRLETCDHLPWFLWMEDKKIMKKTKITTVDMDGEVHTHYATPDTYIDDDGVVYYRNGEMWEKDVTWEPKPEWDDDLEDDDLETDVPSVTKDNTGKRQATYVSNQYPTNNPYSHKYVSKESALAQKLHTDQLREEECAKLAELAKLNAANALLEREVAVKRALEEVERIKEAKIQKAKDFKLAVDQAKKSLTDSQWVIPIDGGIAEIEVDCGAVVIDQGAEYSSSLSTEAERSLRTAPSAIVKGLIQESGLVLIDMTRIHDVVVSGLPYGERLKHLKEWCDSIQLKSGVTMVEPLTNKKEKLSAIGRSSVVIVDPNEIESIKVLKDEQTVTTQRGL